MMRFRFPFVLLILTGLMTGFLMLGDGGGRAQPGPCGLVNPAFCDTFDTGQQNGGRAGELDEAVYSVARLVPQGFNPSQGQYNPWKPNVVMNHCGEMRTVTAPNDTHVCNGHFMEVFDDLGTFAGLAVRVRQPFDFAGRTGTVTYEVDAKSMEHRWWTEFWVADTPIPVPYDNNSFPRNGFGFTFSYCGNVGAADVTAFNVFTNYQRTVVPRQLPPGNPCIAWQDNVRQRIEVRLSQQRVEVWGADAGNPLSFRMIAYADGLNLPFTRGYVSLEHWGYNAEKYGGPSTQTFHWDTVGFDGPLLPRPRAYDVPHNGYPVADRIMLGYYVNADGMYRLKCCPPVPQAPFVLPGVDLFGATGASLNFSAIPDDGLTKPLQYRFNAGAWRDVAWPVCCSQAFGLSLPVALSDLVPGDNTLAFRTLGGAEVAIDNIDLTIETGAVPSPTPTPTPTATPSPTPTSTPSPTPSPSPSPTPVPTPTASPSPSPSPTATPTPSPSPAPTPTPSPSPTASPGPTIPATPSDLRVTEYHFVGFTLAWNDNSANEDRFEVLVCNAGGSPCQPVYTFGANATGGNVLGLTPSTTYWLNVRACNVAGCSVWAPGIEARTLP